jgi:hypothetical protein
LSHTSSLRILFFRFFFYFIIFIFTHMYIHCLGHLSSPQPHLPSRTCSTLLFSSFFEEKIWDNKKDITSLLVWDKDSYTERFLSLLPCTCVQPEIFFFFFFAVLGLELSAFTLSHSTSPVFFVWRVFRDRVLWIVYLGWLWSSILLISAF